jgi:hypothetical protein
MLSPITSQRLELTLACGFARLIGYHGGMYGLSKDLDLSFFVGKTLNSVSFSLNTIYFGFDGNVSIDLSSSYQHQQKADIECQQSGTIQAVFKCPNSSLMQLLEHSVILATAGDDGSLSLTFDNGDVLKCIETPGPYECYEFSDGKNAWVV